MLKWYGSFQYCLSIPQNDDSIHKYILLRTNVFPQYVAAHFGGLVVDHLSEPIVLDHGSHCALTLHLPVACQGCPQCHYVQGLHQYHLPYGHGEGSERNGFGDGLDRQHEGLGQGHGSYHDQVQRVLRNGQRQIHQSGQHYIAEAVLA